MQMGQHAIQECDSGVDLAIRHSAASVGKRMGLQPVDQPSDVDPGEHRKPLLSWQRMGIRHAHILVVSP